MLRFNLIKGLINALLTQVLYKRLSSILKEAEKDVAVQSGNKG